MQKLNKLLALVLIIFLTCSTTVYASLANQNINAQTNKLASTQNNQSTAENSEQYKLTINKGEHVNDAHVEVLPDTNNEYWIPKNYKVHVTGDYEGGYINDIGEGTYDLDEAKTVTLSATPGVNPTTAELLEKIEALEDKVSTLCTDSPPHWYSTLCDAKSCT